MSKTSTLVKNTAIIGIGTISTKALTFLLLPLYTYVLAPEDYGLIDVLMTMSSLIIPFITLEMSSGVFRFLIGSEERKNYSLEEVVTTGATVAGIGFIVSLMLSLVINFFYTIPYYFAVVLYIFSLSVSNLTTNITRGFGDNVSYSVASFIITLVTLVLNIVLILVFKWGAIAILIATAIGNFSGSIFLLYKEKIYKYITKHMINLNAGKEMLRYTLPLIPNSISWWVASASDRIIVLWFLGTAANGIYAAAHKIPGIYATLFSIFSLAWTESVARNASDNYFVENTVKKCTNVMVYMLFGIISCTSLFFNILIGSNYSSSYWHIFILLIAIFFSSLSSIYGGIFGGKMDSKTVAYTTFIGAIINILVNLCFVNFIGLYAASMSTAISYVFISLIRGKKVKKWYNIKLFSLKDIYFLPLGVLCAIGYYFHNNIINIASILFIIICFAYFNKEIVYSFFTMIERKC